MRFPSIGLLLLWPALAVAQQNQQPVSPSPPPVLFQPQSPTDPTSLTSQQLFRELGTLEKSINGQLAAIIKNADEFKSNLTHFPTEVDQKITQMEELQRAIIKGENVRVEQQFSGIALQFKERDVRTDLLAASLKDALNQAAIASKIAVDAALQAQEKAFTTQNANFAASLTDLKTTFGKLIENQQTLLAQNSRGLDDKIAAVKDDSAHSIAAVKDDASHGLGALKDQVTAIDARSHGFGDSWSVMLLAGGFMVSVGGLLIMVFRGTQQRGVYSDGLGRRGVSRTTIERD